MVKWRYTAANKSIKSKIVTTEKRIEPVIAYLDDDDEKNVTQNDFENQRGADAYLMDRR